LRLDDEVLATLWLERRTERSLTLRYEFRPAASDGPPAVEVRITHVHTLRQNGALRASPLPAALEAVIGPAPASGERE
jgi:acyl-CoA thioesterase FadM